jgi:hypothetical protein
MTDDIVTRLQERIPYAIHPHVLAEAKLLSDAVKEIERLRNALAEQTITHEVQKTNTLSEIERLRRCLQHAIDHAGKWGLFTAEEKQAILAEYEQAVHGD